MWRNIATMIYGWHEQIQPGGASVEYTLVFATLCCLDTVRIMHYRFSMADETVATRPPWLDSSLPRLPCRGISVLRSTILQPLSSFAMRSCGSMPVPSPCPRRTSLTLWLNINKKTRCSKLHLCFYSSVLLFCYSSLLCCSALFLLLKPASWLSRGHFSRPAFSAP